MQFVLRTLAIFVAVTTACWIVPGVDIEGSWADLLVVALVIALLNMTVKPIAQLLGAPITMLSLGVFYIVVNTLLLYLAAWLGQTLFGADLQIASFGSGFVAAIVISIVSAIMNAVLGVRD